MGVPGQRCVSCGKRIKGEFIGKVWHSQRCALLLAERLFVSVPDVIELLPPKWRFDQGGEIVDGRQDAGNVVTATTPLAIPFSPQQSRAVGELQRDYHMQFNLGDLGRLATSGATGQWFYAIDHTKTKYFGPYRSRQAAKRAERRHTQVTAERSAFGGFRARAT